MAAIKDEKTRRRLLCLSGWGALAALIAFTVYVYFSDPFAGEGSVTICTFHALTGLDCPGCGMTRAAWLLMHGQPLASLKQNPFLFIIVIAVYMGFAELSPYMIGKQLPQLTIPNWLLIVLIVLVCGFCVVRNVLKFI